MEINFSDINILLSGSILLIIINKNGNSYQGIVVRVCANSISSMTRSPKLCHLLLWGILSTNRNSPRAPELDCGWFSKLKYHKSKGNFVLRHLHWTAKAGDWELLMEAPRAFRVLLSFRKVDSNKCKDRHKTIIIFTPPLSAYFFILIQKILKLSHAMHHISIVWISLFVIFINLDWTKW